MTNFSEYEKVLHRYPDRYVPIDWEQIDAETIDLIFTQGQVKLQQTTVMTQAGAARATTLCGIFAAGSAGMLAIAATILTASLPHWPLFAGAGLAGLMLFLAALLAYRASPSSLLYPSGFSPKEMAAVPMSKHDLMKCCAEETAYGILVNNAWLEDTATRLWRAFRLGAAAIPAGFMCAVLACLAHRFA